MGSYNSVSFTLSLTQIGKELASDRCTTTHMKLAYTDIAELRHSEKESILRIKVLEGAEMTLENTRKHYQIISKLTDNKKYLALVDASNFFTVTPEALRHSSLPEVVSNRLASAHFNSSTMNKLTTNFFATYYRPPIPIRIFDTENEALAWLLSMYKANAAVGGI
jgi:hypothetical protein